MNILASPLPATVDIGGASVPIRTGYRHGIQVARVADSGMDPVIVAATILRIYLVEPPRGIEAALDACMRFHRGGADEPSGGGSGARLLDWDHDAGRILADFRREYSIDLADPATDMHWWVFLALLSGLSPEAELSRAMHWRDATKPKGMKGEEARQWDRMKKAYALPPRTTQEAISREAAMWGDD